MKVAALLLLSAALCTAQTSGSDHKKQVESVNTRGCADLTLVLDNWKYAITSQVKDLLLHNHNTVLPDYGRIQPLSNALEDLYQEFNQLKQRLSHLSGQFINVEAIVGNMTTPHQKR
uniref:Uncharacterized protein n=1 Tax=Gouania willdenowi TaxID=441366 RepID=A0A8C5GQQ7_GOUWI